MTDEAERVAQIDHGIGNGRRRTMLLLLAAAVGGAALWAFTLGPANALTKPPIVHGTTHTEIRCVPDLPTQQVEDTFGGGGVVVRYREGARCELAFTITNVSDAAVTVTAVERTPEEFTRALRLTDATRAAASVQELHCYGCDEHRQRFTPFVLAPGDEWEIGVSGVMDGCSAPKTGLGHAGRTVVQAIEVTIRVLGVTRVVPVELAGPYAVAVDECRG